MKLILMCMLMMSITACATKTSNGTADLDNVRPEISPVFEIDANNTEIQKWVKYFTEKDRKRFSHFLNRGEHYRDLVQATLESYSLPIELYYLAMIESGYVSHATSHASAVGTWQFISSTGKRYGLYIDNYVDERRDPIRSTEAAAKYLTDLYNVFQSWELALAAYNCGENRVLRAVMRGKTRDFWELSRKKLLPSETRNYVPKFLAALFVGENAEDFDFVVKAKEKHPDMELVSVPSPIALKKVSEVSKTDINLLKKLNPNLKKGVTPLNASEYELWLPKENALLVTGLYDEFKKHRFKPQSFRPSPQSSTYIVKSGDNLSQIARKHDLSLYALKTMNNLRSSMIKVGQVLRVKKHSYKRSYHIVSRGDNLSNIARRYSTSVRKLMVTNKLRSSVIKLGQKLSVPRPGAVVYKVRRGDSLFAIAQRFNTRIHQIKRWNNLTSNQIFPGQKIVLNID